MQKIPTILKGDDSGIIELTMAEGRSYEGATLVVAYQGVTRKFTDLVAGQKVNLAFTHDETAGFKLGCKPLLMRLIGPLGAVETVENAEMRIKVTDCLGELNAGGSFLVEPGATAVPVTDVGDVGERYTLADLHAKINSVIHVLAQRSLLSLAVLLAAGAAFGASARFNTLFNDDLVVTNVDEIAAAATAAQAAAATAQQTASAAQTAATTAQQTADEATRLVGALADEKRDKTDMDYGGFWTAGDVVLLPNEDYEYQPFFESADGAKRLYWQDTWYYAYQVDPLRESYAYDSETGGNMVYDTHATEFWVGPDGSRVRAVFAAKTRLATTNDVSSSVAQIGEVAARAVTQPEGSAEPDDYRVQIGHGATATGPAGAGADSAGRNQSIAIGYNATATNWTSVAIGSGGWSELTNALGVVTGRVTNAATADGREAVAIGYGSKAHGNMSTAVGKLAQAHGDYSAAFGAQASAGQHGVAIGFGADASRTRQKGIAIGRYANVDAENAVQLFTGTNETANSIKIGDTFVWRSGHPANEADPQFAAFTNQYLKVDKERFNVAIGQSAAFPTDNPDTTKNASVVVIGRSSRVEAPYGDAQASIAIGMQAKSANISAITIGHSSSNYGKRSIAIGRDVVISNDTDQANMDAIAIGYQAKGLRQQTIAIGKTAVANNSGAVQIGTGENTVANSLKFRNTTVVGGDGKVPFASLAGAYPEASGNQLSAQVATISAHLNAEDARFVSTNYNSATHMPEASVEVKLPDQTWSTVWREMTRWNWLMGEFLPASYASKADLDEKADRAWGFYDSHAGTWAPDGYTWISSPRIAVAGGLAYQRTVTSEGAVWVLESNGMVAQTGGATNGFFRVSDDEGNTQFEIVKGDRRTVGADANGVETLAGFSPTRLRIVYSVVAEAHPTIRVCTDLAAGAWVAEDDADCPATVTWSGASGAYVAQVQGKTALPALFVKATYQTGGETYIRNAAPVSMTHVVIGGAKYAVGTATISGHTVMTLTPAP